MRRDSFVHQDLTAQAIVEDVFRDYPQAHFRWDVTATLRTRSLCCQFDESDLDFIVRLLAEEGLSYRFEHLADEEVVATDESSSARHVLVIADATAERPDLGEVRFTTRHGTANL